MTLKIVGTGPGRIDEMTGRAGRAVEEADIIVGYTLYNELLQKQFPDKEYYATPMRQETERCRYALEKAAQGLETVLVCSGDSGVYGMASLVFELAEQMARSPDIEVIPGITAALSGGARLGSPLSNDFAVISLSDLLTPWAVIEKRLRGAAYGDFVIALYNPGSKKRREHLRKACDIVMERRGADTPCGIVHNIGRDGEMTEIMTLGELRDMQADMFMTVFIGNSVTRVIGDRLVTPRGYVENGRTAGGKSDRAAGDGRLQGAAGNTGDCIGVNVKSEKKSGNVYGREDTVLIFGGTTEGRVLAEAAARSGASVVLSVATDYGEEILDDVHDMENIDVHKGHLDTDKIISLIDDIKPCVVFDATHPYATQVTESVSGAAAAEGVRYIRVRRDITTAAPPAAHMIYVPDVSAAAAVINRTAARAFITTGSRGAAAFGRVKDAENRLTIRVLPSEEAVKLCRDAGFKGKNIICMQGPFSAELNEAMFRAAGAEVLVTKLSGKTGGFPEKIEAASRLGMQVIVITPPEDMPGITLEAACSMFA